MPVTLPVSTGVVSAAEVIVCVPVNVFALSVRAIVAEVVGNVITVVSVLALSYVMNWSGQTASLGTALASAGTAFAVMSPLIGWLGVAITGSDTSSNALFGLLQVTAANNAGLNPILMASANSSGWSTLRMPLPPPPARALISTG